MELDRLFEIRSVLQALKPRDIQSTGVVMTWCKHVGISLEELHTAIPKLARLTVMEQHGYFNPNPSVEEARKIRKFEKSLPKEDRKSWRAARLNHTKTGPTYSR